MAPPIRRHGPAALKQRNQEKLRYAKANKPLAYAAAFNPDGTLKVNRQGKFNARSVYTDGHKFPSQAENDRYLQLKELQELGTIDQLELQPAFKCSVAGHLVCTYRADFRYRIKPGQLGQRTLIEEVKGNRTSVYTIKRKLVRALHPGVEIIELNVPSQGMGRFRFLTAEQIGVPEKGDRQTHVKVGARKTGRT